MKLKFLYAVIMLSFFTQPLFSEENGRALRSEKVGTYMGTLKRVHRSFFLHVSSSEVYKLAVPAHYVGVALHSRNKRVEVKAVFIKRILRSGLDLSYLKVRNIVPKR